MTRKDSANALDAARRAYQPPTTKDEQARAPNNSRYSGTPAVAYDGRIHEQRLPGDNRNTSRSSIHASQSTPTVTAGVVPERSAHPPTLPMRSPLDHAAKANNPFSDNAEVTVVESDSDEGEEGGEPFSPEAMPAWEPSDLIFMVMGVTGAGKSTFISLLTDEDVEVGHQLQSSKPSC